MALTMATKKNKKQTFKTNHTTPGIQVKGGTGNGGSQPPRNRTVPSAHNSTTATYSPSMNSIYGVDEYSTMKPATSSDSASSKSKGGRLVSATAETKNTTNIGRSGSQYQPNNPKGLFWAATMALRLSEPAQSNTVMITKPIETS